MQIDAENKITTPACWADIPWGIYHKHAIEQRFEPWLAKLYGNHLLKLGQLSIELDTSCCGIRHQLNMARSGRHLDVKGDGYQIPIFGKSIDACIIAHVIPYLTYPHFLLSEIDRVLTDNGWLLISTFNSMSLLGLGKLIPIIRHQPILNYHTYSHINLVKWLALLSYEVIEDKIFQLFPWQKKGGGYFINSHFPAAGCLNVIIARKRVMPLTLHPLRNKRIPFRWWQSTVDVTNSYKIKE